jgi:hypothetical protein
MATESPKLEDFLAGKPLSPRMAALMRGEPENDADAEARGPEPEARNYADGTPITNSDREHLRRMVGSAGWGVLLKLLDTELAGQEDAARRISLAPGMADLEITAAWKQLAAQRQARNAVIALVEAEIEKLKDGKAKVTKASRHYLGAAYRAGDQD